MNPKKGGETTQKIKRLQREIEEWKKYYHEERKLVEFWRDQFNELFEIKFFRPKEKKL